MSTPFRVGILGFGGIGIAAARLLTFKKEMTLVAACDSDGLVFNPSGIPAEDLERLSPGRTVGDLPVGGERTKDALGGLIERSGEVDGFFVTLPNLPNDFIPSVVTRFLEHGYRGAFTDALKRTQAMELMFNLHEVCAKGGITYVTGAGCTPGMLSAAAVVAAQSFVEVEHVDIHWGVGISNWESYRGTIREDIAQLPGYTVEKAKALSDFEVESLLNERDGKLRLVNMEHADDLLLEKAGVVKDRSRVTVGGLMDTRSPKKPVSTTLTVTGTTFEGKRATHTFTLGDETSMAANVLGPMTGYLKRALWLREKGICGVFGSTEFMPMVVR